MKQILPMITLCLMAISMSAVAESTAIPQGYVDLGLPSGTLWKTKNEVREEFPNRNAYWFNSLAAEEFGNQLPTVEQLDELRNACQWIWMGNGYKVVGINGESIFLPAAGAEPAYLGYGPRNVGSIGYYCSSSEFIVKVKDEDREYEDWAEHSLFFNSDEMVIDTTIGNETMCYTRSVRLVKSAAPRYVDPGLRSGTLWKGQNEGDGFYTYAEAKAKFGMRVPTEAQFEELRSACRWEWTGIQYKITGPNNQCIFLPAPGVHVTDKTIIHKGIRGEYWSSTSHDSDQSYLWLNSRKTQMAELPDHYKMSIRLAEVPRGYVDLGLPSGTLWKTEREVGLYTYAEAMSKFGKQLPTSEQIKELGTLCKWVWTDTGYKITGPSGKSIFLRAAGGRDCSNGKSGIDTHGYYWSSDPYDANNALFIYFTSGGVEIGYAERCYGFCVYLVR